MQRTTRIATVCALAGVLILVVGVATLDWRVALVVLGSVLLVFGFVIDDSDRPRAES